MKKLTERQKKFVREIIKELQYALFLTEYEIDVCYQDIDHPKKPGLVAEIFPSHIYFTAEILIYPLFWEKSLEERRSYLVHEMCHIYTEPYKEMWERMSNSTVVSGKEEAIINERLTTLIERVVSVAFKDRLKKIKM